MAYHFVPGSSQSLDSTSGGFDGTMPFTMFQWLYCAANNVDNGVSLSITDKHASNDDRVSINPYSDGTLYLSARGLSGVPSFAVAYTGATWLAVTAVLKSSIDRDLYVNGSTANNTVATGTFPTFTHTVVGAKWDNTGSALGSFFQGDIGETALWNVELTLAEIQALEQGFSPRLIRPSALRLYKNLIRDENSPFIGVSLTNNNAATVIAHPPVIYPAASKRYQVAPPFTGGVFRSPVQHVHHLLRR